MFGQTEHVRPFLAKVFGRICQSRVNITILTEIDDGITLWRGHQTSHLVSCHPIEVSIRIHKLKYLSNVAVGHDPLTQEGLGLLLPKGEHTSLRGVFSLGLYGLESRQGLRLDGNLGSMGDVLFPAVVPDGKPE